MLKIYGIKFNVDTISLIFILIGEICFYTSETLYIYLILTGLGIIMGIINNLNRFTLKIRKDNFILWICMMFFIYFLYGLFFLKKGEFTWDTMGYRMLEIISLYLVISNITLHDINELKKAMVIAGLFSIIYLVTIEHKTIVEGSQRIGDSLSGNVNTAGYNFGIISNILMWFFCKEKKKYQLFLVVLLSFIMLLTGSKKVIIMIFVNLAMYFWYERKKITTWIKIIIIIIIAVFAIFNIPYLYEIIGSRIVAMFDTMILGNASSIYSHSTDVREKMIQEAFNLFLNKPIFGGGWNYFFLNTIYEYEYSHCNYTEMLCSFGLFGTSIFYGRHIHDIIESLNYKYYKLKLNHDFTILIIALTLESLVLDIAAVTFSAQCVWYLPFIFSAAALKTMRNNAKIL